MEVKVKLFAGLRSRLARPGVGGAPVELPEGTRLEGLLNHLDITKEQAQMVLLNGQQLPATWEKREGITLRDGDTISIFPPLAGG